MNDQTSLVQCFFTMCGRFFADHSNVKHELNINQNGESCVLTVPMTNPDGFNISAEVSENEITIHCADFHYHHELRGEPADFVNQFLGYLYDLLSPLMRLRVFKAGEKAYKWSIEGLDNDEWITESTTGDLFFNFLGKRNDLILQNRTVEIRDNPYDDELEK